jgi:hypothetical protein
VLGPLALLAGVGVEIAVLRSSATDLEWLAPILAGAGVAGAAALAFALSATARRWVLIGALGVLLLAPAVWSVQTLGHATSGTFPAGGPASASGGGPGGGGPGGGGPPGMGGGPGMGAGPGGAAGPGAAAGPNGMAPPGGTAPGMGGADGSGSGALPGPGGSASPGAGGSPGAMGGGGGPFGGDTSSVNAALEYAASHGGGTVAVSSQMGAGRFVSAGADVAAIGGFSGRESQVSIAWLADAVEQGRIRYVLADGGGGLPNDGRVGARDVMAAVAETCTPVSSVDGLYDCSGSVNALRAAAS